MYRLLMAKSIRKDIYVFMAEIGALIFKYL